MCICLFHCTYIENCCITAQLVCALLGIFHQFERDNNRANASEVLDFADI